MRVGPTIEARAMTITMTIPKTASLFLSSRRHASRQSEVPSIASDVAGRSFMGESFAQPADREISWSSGVSNSRINEAVGNVDKQIENQNCDGDEGDDADNERLVAIKASINKIVSQTGQCENLFNHDRAGYQKRQSRPGKGNHWQQTAPHGMSHDDLTFAQTFCSRCADV